MTKHVLTSCAVVAILTAAPTAAMASSMPRPAALPHVITAHVEDSADGAARADGLTWRAWSDADPTLVTLSRPDDERVGAVGPNVLFGDVAANGEGDFPCGFTSSVETSVRGAGYFAVTRGSGIGPRNVLADTQLVPVPVPDARRTGSDVSLRWEPAESNGVVLGAAQGLVALAIERSADGARFTEVGRVAPDAGEAVEARVPAGAWAYALRPIYQGGVAAEVRSRASDVVRAGSGVDLDGDTVADERDGCVIVSDAGQADRDGDGITDACDFRWADCAPRGAPNGSVDVGDVVLMLRMAVGLERPTASELRVANVAPAILVRGLVDRATPRMDQPAAIAVDDVVLALRASVGLVAFPHPR